MASKAVIPHALVVSTAVGTSVGTGADLVASLQLIIPIALIIGVTGDLLDVAVGTLLHAVATAGYAEGRAKAELRGVVGRASHGALLVDSVPHATGLEVAIKLVIAEEETLHLAGAGSIVHLALVIRLAAGRAVVVLLTHHAALTGLTVPLAARVGLGCTLALGTTQGAGTVAGGVLLGPLGVTITLPLATLLDVALTGSVTVAAVLVASVLVEGTVAILEAGALGHGGAVTAARDLKELIVVAHWISVALRLLLKVAGLATLGAKDIPHAILILVANTLGGVAVLALLLAGAVGGDGLADLGLAPHGKVTGSIAVGLHDKLEGGGTGKIKVDVDGNSVAADVAEGEDVG